MTILFGRSIPARIAMSGSILFGLGMLASMASIAPFRDRIGSGQGLG